MSELAARLQAALRDRAGVGVEVRSVEPLAGGACQDNFRVELAGDRRMVLRSDAPRSLPRSLGRREEFAVIRAAVSAGVRTPEARWLLQDVVRQGAWAYLMDFADGVAIGRQVLTSEALAGARAGLAAELAIQLARIHTITPAKHPDLFAAPAPADPVRSILDGVRQMIDALPEPHPALELAYVWLEDHRPERTETTLVHGDFRTGNFLVTPAGLSAVLDWEFALWGLPEEDLAWISVRDWRFGALKRPIGGFADRAPFYAAYAEASGRAVRRDVVHWCEVLGNVRWGAGCVYQGERYLSGEVRDMELIAIARRAAEMEYEALRLMGSSHAG
jgi:aminoglycoside phosphotransferase (APT) family kinase protein